VKRIKHAIGEKGEKKIGACCVGVKGDKVYRHRKTRRKEFQTHRLPKVFPHRSQVQEKGFSLV
jgi:hypothetical protein